MDYSMILEQAHSPAVLSDNAVDAALSAMGEDLRKLTSDQITNYVINAINLSIAKENRANAASNPDTPKIPQVTRLNFSNLATLLRRLYVIVTVAPTRNTDPDMDLLAIYDSDPSSPHYGTYRTSHDHLRQIARQYCRDLTSREFIEVMVVLKDTARRVTRDTQRDLVAVNNGIFNFATKKLQDFSPEFVFLAKSPVNYVADAPNPVIHHPEDGTEWDIESWMHELSDDPEIVELLWEIISATVRPYVSWNKSAWFYSEKGNNGKGTLISLMRNIVGHHSYASIPLSDFGKDFMLEPLTRASAILVDENDVGTFIDKAANLKAVVTGDVITINRKYKDPIAYTFHGFMVQCLNEFPKISDKSESFYRRQLFVPFLKSFTGVERRYIKDDYLKRREVLEYALWRALHMTHHELSTPEATVAILNEYKEYADPVRAFWNEFCGQFAWDLLPTPFLWDLYKAWFEKNMPSSKPLGRNTFLKQIITVSTESGEWVCPDAARTVRPGTLMDAPEPLSVEYQLRDWLNPNARDGHPDQGIPPLRPYYRGILRANVLPGGGQ